MVRPYTPVDQGLTASSQGTHLFFMVKVYPHGEFSSYLSALHVGRSSRQHRWPRLKVFRRAEDLTIVQTPASL